MTETTDDRLIAPVLEAALRIYDKREQRGPLRGGLGDAATICDIIAKEIEASGRPSQLRREMAAVAKRCADAIWSMREKVDVPHE